MSAVRDSLLQPFVELEHSADFGIEVEGDSAEEMSGAVVGAGTSRKVSGLAPLGVIKG